jgi:hypothetical protein
MTAVRSGHGVGKSMTAAIAAAWFLWANPRSKVITTAPTWRQVEKILWSELGSLVSIANSRTIRLPSGLRIGGLGPAPLNTQWKLANDWFAEGISTRNIESFQGIHAPRVFGVLDEASGVPSEIFRAVDDITTGPDDRILAIGNPTQNAGQFFSIFNNARIGAGWTRFHVNCEEMPWIKAGTPPPYPGLVSAEWLNEKRDKYGRTHPIYAVHVRGDFAATSDNLLLSLFDMIAAVDVDPPTSSLPTSLGVDVADFGSNKTVLTWWVGNTLRRIEKYTHRDVMEVAGLVKKHWEEDRTEVLAVDADGIGRGVSARLAELGVAVTEFRGGASPESDEYLNARAEAAFGLATAIKRGLVRLPDDEELQMQASYLPYRLRSDGKLAMVSKEDLAAKGYPSPDCWDSAMMGRWGQLQGTFDHIPVIPARRSESGESIRAARLLL